jgi:TolA-binding protein
LTIDELRSTIGSRPRIAAALFQAVVLVVLVLAGGCAADSEQDWFAKADDLVLDGKHREAVATLERYLEKFPEGALRDRALFRSGEILYFSLAERSLAVKNFSRLVRRHPNSKYAFRAHEILAGAFLDETREYLPAVLEYKWLLKQDPHGEKAALYQFQAARCYLLGGDYEQAVLEFGLFVRDYPDSELMDRAYDELGGAYLVLGRPRQAMFIFKKLLEKFPESPLGPTAEFKVANALEDLHLYAESLEVYEGLLERYPNRPAVEVRIAGLKSRQKNQQGSVKAVDYNWRPDETTETLKNFKEEEKKKK